MEKKILIFIHLEENGFPFLSFFLLLSLLLLYFFFLFFVLSSAISWNYLKFMIGIITSRCRLITHLPLFMPLDSGRPKNIHFHIYIGIVKSFFFSRTKVGWKLIPVFSALHFPTRHCQPMQNPSSIYQYFFKSNISATNQEIHHNLGHPKRHCHVHET